MHSTDLRKTGINMWQVDIPPLFISTNLESKSNCRPLVQKYVILSGGLGSSAYVLQRLHEYIETSDRSSLRGTKVQMCAEPQLVVAKGLLLEQFNKTLRTRIARASYGIIAPQRYSEKAGHFSPHIVVDCFDDHKYVMDRIHWFVKRGEKMASGAVLTVPIERRVALDEPLFFKETVVSCDNPDGCVPENMTDRMLSWASTAKITLD